MLLMQALLMIGQNLNDLAITNDTLATPVEHRANLLPQGNKPRYPALDVLQVRLREQNWSAISLQSGLHVVPGSSLSVAYTGVV